MGNTQSEVTAGAKGQADFDPTKNKIYSLANLKKGGLLVALMRDAFRRRDFSDVDDKIRELVLPFVYNEGRGKKIPLSTIIRKRNQDRPPSKRLPASSDDGKDDDNDEDTSKSTGKKSLFSSIWSICHGKKSSRVGSAESLEEKSSSQEPTREVCWKLSERGTLGETVLHMCLLIGTVVHLELCRRLVRLFPKMVNDVYGSDEFYGEGPLHMAIVNEDPAMVKFLIDHGADIEERAVGNFFCADDQKDGRIDNLSHEYFDLPIETNFAGHVYWGEYPLSFAACLELEDCYRLLLAKGANHDRGDSNGNTVVHMTVIVNKQKMFDLAYGLGADISVKNRQGMSPLALAAKLTRADMFFHILNLIRDVYWIFTNIAFASYPLDELDSIDVETGEVNTTSALTVIVFGEELGHLDLMSGVIVELLKKKWDTFAKKQFFRQIKLFSVYFLISLLAFVLRPAPDREAETSVSCPLNMSTLTTPSSNLMKRDIEDYDFSDVEILCWGSDCKKPNSTKTYIPMDDGKCYLLNFASPLDKIRRILEIMTLIGAIMYLFSFVLQLKRIGFQMFIQTWSAVPGRVIFLISCLLILASFPLRLLCLPLIEDYLISLAMFMTPLHFLFFCRGFKAVGPFVIMIYKMIVSDLLCFVLIYMIFVLGFGQAFFVIFRSHHTTEQNPNIYFSGFIDSMMTMFLMSLMQFEGVYVEFGNTDHPYLAKTLFLIYMTVVSVLLVNMLIAMMGHTYEDIAHRPNEWMRQWARIVLIVERGLTKEERLKFQETYCEMRDGKKVFILKWEIGEEERECIQELKDLKSENKSNREKRKSQLPTGKPSVVPMGGTEHVI